VDYAKYILGFYVVNLCIVMSIDVLTKQLFA